MNDDAPPQCTVIPVDYDLFHWESNIEGPPDSPYEGRVFLTIDIPTNYLFKPPRVTFKTCAFHPNINNSGIVCMNILRSEWTPAFTIYKGSNLNMYSEF